MDLQIVWFVVVAVFWTGFFVLEGFDFGVGMLLHLLGHGPGIGKNDQHKRRFRPGQKSQRQTVPCDDAQPQHGQGNHHDRYGVLQSETGQRKIHERSFPPKRL